MSSQLPLSETKDITDPRESDVLCGRGGAALRHPGNQTYRRLVNLNKGLYITCLKTEKLKISRSIVAAIREQNGRFLERNAESQTWFDIGDKKAIEKTSQALREGQPKLRQKMVEMGAVAAAPGQGLSLEQLNGGKGIYTTSGSVPSNSGSSNSNISSGSAGGGGSNQNGAPFADQQAFMQMQQRHQQQPMQFQQMPAPQGRSSEMSMNTLRQSDMSMNTMTSEMMLQRLSINSINNPDQNVSQMSLPARLRPSLDTRGSQVAQELGFNPESRLSIMSQFSSMGEEESAGQTTMGGEAKQNENNTSRKPPPGAESMPPPPPPPPPIDGPMIASPAMPSPSMQRFDRRRIFARMKVNRPPSGRFSATDKPTADGMPDIHMVDSQFSLMSNISGHEKRSDPLKYSDHGMKFSDHQPSEYANVFGSRRSLMSGLSRISDSSDMNSIFSDLSKKIAGTNISTRSIAMSDVSGIEEGDHEDLDESFKHLLQDPLADSMHTKPNAAPSSNMDLQS